MQSIQHNRKNRKHGPDRPYKSYISALFSLSVLSVGLFVVGVIRGNGWSDWYLVWNLFLAWVPLLLASALIRRLRVAPWSSWSAISLSLAWLLFLPNSFYMVSDFIHLEDMQRVSVLFDALTFTVFVLNRLLLGFTSLYLVQSELRKRRDAYRSTIFAVVVLLACSFAIYLGRDLRWNSWDVLVNPAGILFDVSERILDPIAHPDAVTTTAMFFIFLAGLYWILGRAVQAVGDFARSRKDWP